MLVAHFRVACNHRHAKLILFFLACLPLLWLVGQLVLNPDGLGANPQEALERATGDWSLRFLCLTLAITPIRVLLKIPTLVKFRRMLGLFMYAYVFLHLLCYIGFDMEFNVNDIVKDIPKRPFILVGFLAFLLLTPLSATSFNAAIKYIGINNWQLLHKAVYLVVVLGMLHFFWMKSAKQNFSEVLVYGLIFVVLTGYRLYVWWEKRHMRKSKDSI